MRNYEVGSILMRHEASRGYVLLEVEKITLRCALLNGNASILVRHEDGHREALSARGDVALERALFGYHVVTGEELAQGFAETPRGKVLIG